MRVLALLAPATLALIIVTAVAFAVRDDGAPNPQASGPYRGSEPPGAHPLPDFVLRDYEGELVRSDDLRQGVFVLTFLDAQCGDVCPIIAAQLAQTLAAMPRSLRSEVSAVALSTDPEEDTRAAVRSFLRRTRADGAFRYLTGPAETLKRLWRELQILSSFESGNDSIHAAPVRIYADGLWVATLHAGVDLTSENLIHDLRVAVERTRNA